MIYISHRGNLDGINSDRENSPSYINECLELGHDCEIDLRMWNGVPYLGHDSADYPVSKNWLIERKDNLWIHVKEYAALVWLMENCPMCKFFCHESDRYTLTSNGYVWSHDLDNQMTKKCIVPLLSLESVKSYGQTGFYAVCSDYINSAVLKFGDQK
jgi:hypothetical protein